MPRETAYTPEAVASEHIQKGIRAAFIYLDMDYADVDGHEDSTRDFYRYLKAVGVRYFGKRDRLTVPNNRRKAKQVNYVEFLPPRYLWPLAAIVLRLGDFCREGVGRGVKIRNLWRPQPYNELVSTSGINSDHPNCCGADFDFKTLGDRKIAQGIIFMCAYAFPELQISIGIGYKTLHVGALSPMGRRQWLYKSIRKEMPRKRRFFGTF